MSDCGAIPGVRVYLCNNTRGTGTNSGFTPGVHGTLGIMSRQSHTQNMKLEIHLHPFMFRSLLSETAVLVAAVLQISVDLFSFGSLGGTQSYQTCLCMYECIRICFQVFEVSFAFICSCTHKTIGVSFKFDFRRSSRLYMKQRSPGFSYRTRCASLYF